MSPGLQMKMAYIATKITKDDDGNPHFNILGAQQGGAVESAVDDLVAAGALVELMHPTGPKYQIRRFQFGNK